MSKLILNVEFNEDTDRYSFEIGRGNSVGEVIFGVTAVIKALIRDGYISSMEDAMDMLQKYLTDPMYDEIEGEN